MGFVPFSPLGRGFLSAKLRTLEGLPAEDFRRGTPRFQGANLERNLGLVDRLGAVAEEKHCTPAQLALAWLLVQGEELVPIPGTKRRRYLEENVAATELRLSRSDVDRIEAAIPKGSAAGERYSPASQALVDR